MLLIITRDDQEIRVLPLEEGTTHLGQNGHAASPPKDNDLDDMNIEVQGGRAFVRWPDEDNSVDEDRVELQEGQAYRVGRYALSLRRPAGGAAPAADDDEEDDLDGVFSQALGALFDDDDDDVVQGGFDFSLDRVGVGGGLPVPPEPEDEALEVPALAPSAEVVASPRMQLVVRSGPSTGRVFPIVGDKTFIGSAEGMDVPLPHDSIARRHAVFIQGPTGAQIRDVVGDGRLKVNGVMATLAEVFAGDHIQLGDVDLELVWDGAGSRARTTDAITAPPSEPGKRVTPPPRVVVEEEPRKGLPRWILAVAAVVALGGGVALVQSLSREPAPVRVEVDPKVLQDARVRWVAALTLADLGRFDTAAALLEGAPSELGPYTAEVMSLRRRVEAERVVGILDKGLSEQVLTVDAPPEVRAIFWKSRGMSELAAAEAALEGNVSLDAALTHAREAAWAFERCSWLLRGKVPEIEKARDRVARVMGRLLVLIDSQAAQLKQLSPASLITEADLAMERGDLVGAQRRYLRLADPALAEATDSERQLAREKLAQIEDLQTAAVNRLMPLLRAAVEGGDLLLARDILDGATRLSPTEQALPRQRAEVQAELESQAEGIYKQASSHERTKKARLAALLYWQVLEYVADPSKPLYGKARARLDALDSR